MRSFLVIGAVSLLSLAGDVPTILSRPIDGVYAKQTEVAPDGWTVTKRFRGGERASVQVTRLGKKTTTTVLVTIFDDKGVVVAEDKGRTPPASDMVAVNWYPPRDAEYRIKVSNEEKTAITYFIAIR